jgi:DNA-binding response OmpR family regulator
MIVSNRKQALEQFSQALTQEGRHEIAWVQTGEAALDLVRQKTFQLVVVDHDLKDTTTEKLCKDLLDVNALINTAAVSELSEEDFHEDFEGLGILAHLPLEPRAQDADAILEKLSGLAFILTD